MKKQLLITITVLFSSIISSLPLGESCGGVSAQTTFQKKISGIGKNYSTNLFPNSGNGRTYIPSFNEALKQTSDSGYILLQFQTPTSGASLVESSYSLVKTDKTGNVSWTKGYANNFSAGVYGIIIGFNPRGVITTADKGFLMFGYASISAGSVAPYGSTWIYRAAVVKTDSVGNVEWSEVIGGVLPDQSPKSATPDDACDFVSGRQTGDGGYILAGYTHAFGTKGLGVTQVYTPASGWTLNGYLPDVYLVKLTSTGTLQWTKTYGTNTAQERATSVIQTADGGFAIAGTSQKIDSLPYGVVDYSYRYSNNGLVIKTDTIGNLQWNKVFSDTITLHQYNPPAGGWEFNPSQIQQTTDGGFVITGKEIMPDINHFSESLGGMALVRLDNTGNELWNKLYFPENDLWLGNNDGNNVFQSPDGGYVIGSNAGNVAARNNNFLLLKTDETGNVQWHNYPAGKHNTDPNSRMAYSCMTPTLDGKHAFYGAEVNNTLTSSNLIFVKTDSIGSLPSNCSSYTPSYCPPIYSSSHNFYITTPVIEGTGGVVSAYTVAVYGAIAKDTITCLSTPIVVDFVARGTVTCEGDSTDFASFSTGDTFEWSFGDPASGTKNTSTLFEPKHLYPSAGVYSVTLTVTDIKVGTIISATHTVSVITHNFLNAGADVSICLGSSTTLSVSSAEPFAFWYWQPGNSILYSSGLFNDSTSINAIATPTITTLYIAKAQNAACKDVDTVIVTVGSALVFTLSKDLTVCQGENTILSIASSDNYFWSTGETTSNINVNPDTTGSYFAVVSNNYCSDTASIDIAVIAVPTVNAGNNVTIINGSEVTLQAISGSTSYNWIPSEGLSCINCVNPISKPTKTTTYFVTTNNNEPCPGTDSITVFVINCGEINAHNSFSPNNDGINDLFYIKNDCIQTVDFKIYDRWGNIVFETTDVNKGWDGMYLGQILNPAVFVYYVKATSQSGQELERKGNVSLIR